jgi:hypothetical protein
MASGDVPEDWRVANVTPIYKKGSKADPSNYRPVSLTSICCKLLESIIRDNMVDHLLENNLIEDSQHGFVKGRSCATNLVEFFDFVTAATDGGEAVDAVFLDFAKAFDKVPKMRLLEKVKGIGVEGCVLKWIENWLTGRMQRVVLDGRSSDWRAVTSGVPQGSVLGPVLFLIFIRDLDGATDRKSLLKKFADDTKVAQKVKEDTDRAALQNVLDKMMAWAAKWGMEFNRQKCKVMHFGPGNPQFQYTMGDHTLAETGAEKDVGVTVTSDLKPAAHCQQAAKTAGVVLGQIGRSFKYRDRNIFPKLYTRYVRPHLEFASVAWSPWLQKDIELLEKVQIRAVNMVNGLGGMDYGEKLNVLGLDRLSDRRIEADLVQMYKVLNGHCNVKKDTWLTMVVRGNNLTRAVTDTISLKKPFARTDKRQNFYTVRICDQWNGLPKEIRAAKTVAQFRYAYRKHKQSQRQGAGASRG